MRMPAVLNDTAYCAGSQCKKEFGGEDSKCCKKAAPKEGWRLNLNLTWTGTNCEKVEGLVPILMSQDGFSDLKDLMGGDKGIKDSMKCTQFGKCEGEECVSATT